MKNILCATAFAVMATGTTVHADELADMYFTGKNPPLTKQETQAIKIAKRWKAGSAQNIAPITGQDGSIEFVFGAQQTSVVCAVLQVCDIALQAGENITAQPLVGDSVRWVTEPAITGYGADQVQHVIIKPLDVGLETTLIIPTDRRTYHLNLKSHRSDYMPKISFRYPDVMEAKWDQIAKQRAVTRETKTIPETREYLGDLDFDYRLTGKAAWKPVRVYNNRVKTIIQMPKTMKETEAPALLVLRGKGKKEQVIVNYRIQGDRYIVDSIFDEAILIAGVGKHQDKVTIYRGSAKDSTFKKRGKI